MNWVKEINLWKYLHLEKNVVPFFSPFVFGFELEPQKSLGWKGFLEIIWSDVLLQALDFRP